MVYPSRLYYLRSIGFSLSTKHSLHKIRSSSPRYAIISSKLRWIPASHHQRIARALFHLWLSVSSAAPCFLCSRTRIQKCYNLENNVYHHCQRCLSVFYATLDGSIRRTEPRDLPIAVSVAVSYSIRWNILKRRAFPLLRSISPPSLLAFSNFLIVISSLSASNF